MTDWQFLLQKDGEQLWQPLESRSLTLEEGRYRMVAQTFKRDTEVEVRISYQTMEEGRPLRKGTKRLRRTNGDGLLAVLPYTFLKVGNWEIRCTADWMSDVLGQTWQEKIQVTITPKAILPITSLDNTSSIPQKTLEFEPLEPILGLSDLLGETPSEPQKLPISENFIEDNAIFPSVRVNEDDQPSLETPLPQDNALFPSLLEVSPASLEPQIDTDEAIFSSEVVLPQLENDYDLEDLLPEPSILSQSELEVTPSLSLENEAIKEDLELLSIPENNEAIKEDLELLSIPENNEAIKEDLELLSISENNDLFLENEGFNNDWELPSIEEKNILNSNIEALVENNNWDLQVPSSFESNLEEISSPENETVAPDLPIESPINKTPAASLFTETITELENLLQEEVEEVLSVPDWTEETVDRLAEETLEIESRFEILLEKELYLQEKEQPFLINGEVLWTDLMEFPQLKVNRQLRCELRDPQNSQLLISTLQPLIHCTDFPYNFSFPVHVPTQWQTLLVLGEIRLEDEKSNILARQSFNISTDLTSLLSKVQPAKIKDNLVVIEDEKIDISPEDISNSLNLANLEKTSLSSLPQPSIGGVLPPRLSNNIPTKTSLKDIELPHLESKTVDEVITEKNGENILFLGDTIPSAGNVSFVVEDKKVPNEENLELSSEEVSLETPVNLVENLDLSSFTEPLEPPTENLELESLDIPSEENVENIELSSFSDISLESQENLDNFADLNENSLEDSDNSNQFSDDPELVLGTVNDDRFFSRLKSLATDNDNRDWMTEEVFPKPPVQDWVNEEINQYSSFEEETPNPHLSINKETVIQQDFFDDEETSPVIQNEDSFLEYDRSTLIEAENESFQENQNPPTPLEKSQPTILEDYESVTRIQHKEELTVEDRDDTTHTEKAFDDDFAQLMGYMAIQRPPHSTTVTPPTPTPKEVFTLGVSEEDIIAVDWSSPEVLVEEEDIPIEGLNDEPELDVKQDASGIPYPPELLRQSLDPLILNDDIPVPAPILHFPKKDQLIAGESVLLQVKIPSYQGTVFVKLWVQDRQTRAILDGPRSIIDFTPNLQGELETLIQLFVPYGSTDIRFEAISIDPDRQQESHKIGIDRTVLPNTINESSVFDNIDDFLNQ